MEELSILSAEEVDNLFTETQETPPESTENNQENNEKKEETTEVDVDNLFTEPESVGSEEHIEEKESTTPEKNSTSPNNFYSSIAKALKDSTFPDLDIENVDDADKFADSFEKLLQSKLDERQKRIDEALSNGVEPDVIKQYESTLSYLLNIKVEDLSLENLQAENLRKQLIFRDLINKGYSQQEAQEETQEIFESGNDIKKAERALKSNITYFQNAYNNELESAKEDARKEKEDREKQAKALQDDILNNDKAFGDINVSKANRQKAYDAITKPIYKDEETGQYLTEIQKYESENKTDFLKYVSLLYVLTNKFQDVKGLIGEKVNKESRKAIRELENTLNNTNRTSDGTLNFMSGVKDDPESIFKGYSLDI